MPQVNVTLPDGSVQQLPTGSTPGDIALSIGPRLYEAAVAAEIDGRLVDLTHPIDADSTVRIITANDEAGREVLLHSTAHLMAQAVKRLYPEAKIAIGPALAERFYYDIDLDTPFTDEMLADIEAEMRRLAEADYAVSRRELSKADATSLFSEQGEDYKLEIIAQIGDSDTVSAYEQEEFMDLCRGPHVPSTGKIRHFKLLNTSGAYWRGDERNKMLQRIYGTSWGTRKELKAYLRRQEEAKQRDHRKLGHELDLFSFHSVAPASPFFHPRGTVIYNELEKFLRELYLKYDYSEVITPLIFDIELWKQSGHWEHYREYMYLIGDDDNPDRVKGVKPMNCPAHALIYNTKLHSYRDLPIRMADFGRLHRFEKAGVLSGLTRVRSFAQDDAHVFCTPDQIGEEITSLFAMVEDVFEPFGFLDVEIKLSTRPEKFIGDPKLWDQAEAILSASLTDGGIKFSTDPGEGAFYGPKIDYFFSDALKRKWQLTTIQLDFSLPERFGLKYIDHHSQEQRPVLIHRAILGSLERFIGVYLEHTAGDFPLWIAPVQAIVLPISEKFTEYGRQVHNELKAAGIRVATDARDEKIGAKIRQAELQKIPVMLIAGEREQAAGTVSLRRRFAGDQGSKPLAAVISEMQYEIATRERSQPNSER
ncbi:MAG: threonine--tRNA ligase [Candidatus Marinimicrobia bacterium]|nr:threonine--tRNA ligase [Candidatus Neomarinimicrobiota bacterium]